MSNVANLELCKELYELSGWGDTDFNYAEHELDGNIILPYYRETENSENWFECPAYDLGYLLRRLPEDAKVWKKKPQRQSLYQAEVHHPLPVCTADKPEDAACRLAIELFKQKVLTK